MNPYITKARYNEWYSSPPDIIIILPGAEFPELWEQEDGDIPFPRYNGRFSSLLVPRSIGVPL